MSEEQQPQVIPATYTVFLKDSSTPRQIHNCVGTQAGSSHMWFYGPLGPIVAIHNDLVLMVEFPEYEPPAPDEWVIETLDPETSKWKPAEAFEGMAYGKEEGIELVQKLPKNIKYRLLNVVSDETVERFE